MKAFSKLILVTIATAGFSHAATTISTKNFTSLSVGIPVINEAGSGLTAGNRSWSVGYFPTGFNFATSDAAAIKGAFVIFGATSTTFAINGGFTGSINATLPANDTTYTGKTIYTLVGNAPTVAGSSLFAILTANVAFPVVDGAGNGLATANTTTAANVVYGKLGPIATQPSGGSFAQGLQVVSVPEASVTLLGALGAIGLLRRRR